jgi:formylmethanofuran:tetrahydromethanopterin formyltransferase
MKLTALEIRLTALATARNIARQTGSTDWSACMKAGWAAAKQLAQLLGTNEPFQVVFIKEDESLRGMSAVCLTKDNYTPTGAKGRTKPAGVVKVYEVAEDGVKVRSFKTDRLVGIAL